MEKMASIEEFELLVNDVVEKNKNDELLSVKEDLLQFIVSQSIFSTINDKYQDYSKKIDFFIKNRNVALNNKIREIDSKLLVTQKNIELKIARDGNEKYYNEVSEKNKMYVQTKKAEIEKTRERLELLRNPKSLIDFLEFGDYYNELSSEGIITNIATHLENDSLFGHNLLNGINPFNYQKDFRGSKAVLNSANVFLARDIMQNGYSNSQKIDEIDSLQRNIKVSPKNIAKLTSLIEKIIQNFHHPREIYDNIGVAKHWVTVLCPEMGIDFSEFGLDEIYDILIELYKEDSDKSLYIKEFNKFMSEHPDFISSFIKKSDMVLIKALDSEKRKISAMEDKIDEIKNSLPVELREATPIEGTYHYFEKALETNENGVQFTLDAFQLIIDVLNGKYINVLNSDVKKQISDMTDEFIPLYIEYTWNNSPKKLAELNVCKDHFLDFYRTIMKSLRNVKIDNEINPNFDNVYIEETKSLLGK